MRVRVRVCLALDSWERGDKVVVAFALVEVDATGARELILRRGSETLAMQAQRLARAHPACGCAVRHVIHDIIQNLRTLVIHKLTMLQKARRHALASPLLVASEEMPPLESANRHPTPSQKLPTSKQPTPPAAPVSAPSLSSASIPFSSLSLNLLLINPPLQTGDSNFVANKTIKEKVPQQKARRHALASPPLVASDEMTPLGPADRHPANSQK